MRPTGDVPKSFGRDPLGALVPVLTIVTGIGLICVARVLVRAVLLQREQDATI